MNRKAYLLSALYVQADIKGFGDEGLAHIPSPSSTKTSEYTSIANGDKDKLYDEEKWCDDEMNTPNVSCPSREGDGPPTASIELLVKVRGGAVGEVTVRRFAQAPVGSPIRFCDYDRFALCRFLPGFSSSAGFLLAC